MNKTIYKIRLKKGDAVIVRSGSEKGRTGKVVAVHPRLNKVTVEGINVAKRHVKPTKTSPRGGIVEVTRPIWVSKVGIVDAARKNKPSRIGIKIDKNGKKQRYLKGSNKEIK